MVVPMATSITGSLVRVGGGVKWLLGHLTHPCSFISVVVLVL